MIQTARIPQYRRCLAGVLAVMLGLGPLATPSYAAPTLLADQPLSAQNQAKPNIVLTVDDSTSMLYDFLPDTVIGKYCRNMTGDMNANCGILDQNNDLTLTGHGKYQAPGYIFQQFGIPYGTYNPAYDASGPGAGCNLATPTCSGGIDPGPLPGVDVYPAGTSPNAGQPYAYWSLWPAPAHNSEFNHVYYNPRTQYDPPLKADGTPYPQMNNWTSVPADPWATSPQYVDLTAPVTVGLWCNSDWTDPTRGSDPTLVTNPAYCRTNGTGASATSATASSADGDYNYPWAPPGINLGNSCLQPPCPTIALSIAWSKVDPKSHAPQPAWASLQWSPGPAQDAKYFYENDNVLWCDATKPGWPHQGVPSQRNDCLADLPLQTCSATPQTCSVGRPQTCGVVPPTCPTAGQTCNPAITQVCNGVTSQTCSDVGNQTCNATSQSCILNAVCNLPDPSTCTANWEPPGCNLCTSECGSCTLTTTCPPGRCSSDGSSCQTSTDCPGTCSVTGSPCSGACPSSHVCSLDGQPCNNGVCATQPGQCTGDHRPCFDNSACLPTAGTCSGSGNPCNDSSSCPVIPAACSIDNQACNASADCNQSTGTCSNSPTVCHSVADCPPNAGQCSETQLACNGSCPPAGQTCPNGLACSSTSPCPPQGTCSGDSSLACQQDSDCTQSHCSFDHSTCTSFCPAIPGASVSATCSDLMAGAFVPNGNFETPIISGFQRGPIVDASWIFVPSSGIQHYGSAFGATLSPNGQQTAFLQNLGSMSQTITLNANSYQISFLAARRAGQIQPVSVMVDGTQIGLVAPLDVNFATFTIPFTVATSGPHTIAFAGTDSSGDNTTFIDAVQIGLTRSLLEDANGAGVVCRHNNHPGGYNSGRYTYPDATFNTPVTAGTGANACVASPRYATVPRHYWKTGLQWCDGYIASPDNWHGYGRGDSDCRDAQDATHIYPRFFQFGQPPPPVNDPTPHFQRTDLIAASAPFVHDWTDDNGPEHISRSFAEEMTNYANWFAYYRTRIQAVKTVTSASFSEIDAKYRVGFHAMFSLPSFLNVADFDSTQKPAWFAKLFGVTIPLGQQTPTLTSLARIGDYFLHGSHPDLSGSTDPIQLSCQQNFHMLFTDGYTNQSELPTTTVGDVDATVPAGPVVGGFPIGLTANPIVGITQGSDWPRPYREDPGAATPTLNALSDYAMAYWVTNLRPGPTAACPLCGTANVPTSNTPPLAADRYSAKWEHLNFAALSLGTSGKLPAADQVAVEADLRNPAGLLQWPQPRNTLGVPDVLTPDNSGVDDLWHAAMNGHGDFVNADSIDEVKLGIGKILAGVGNLPGTATSVGFVSNTFGASADFIYRVRFEQSWSGSLAKIRIDPTTGAVLLVPPPPIWNASDQLIAATTPTDGWRTGRRIVTMNESGVSVPFLWDSLGPNQRDSLAPGKPAARSQLILQFLRGDRSREGEKVGQLRVRTSPMGDIVDSSPVYVGAPSFPYVDASDPGYSGFKNTFATRLPHLYVGGNDGMLHAFDDATGNERWAYVPTPLFRGGTAATLPPVPNDPKTGLGALAYQDGALPAFRHHFYVDSTPKVVDVDFNAPVGDQWRTLLVGGLGKGGNRYYALNVTDPGAVLDEVAAANQVLWEFPPVGNISIDMGYTYGKPVIGKTRALFASTPGNGAWLVIVGSGYNNPSGVGQLYFLQASNPTNFKVMSTHVGSPTAPAGLAHPAGYTQDFHNQLAEQIYAGDLLGNFWRFDVSDPTSANNWDAASGQFARLTSPAGGSVQPVTTPPEIKIDPNGVDRWVFVGTGKLYDESDLADPQLQTMYALRDGTASTPWALPATPIDRTTTGCTPDPCLVPLPATDSTNNFGLAITPAKGWYHDLPAGSRIVVAPQAAVGVIAYIATKAPSADLCVVGLPVTVYAREYGTGQSLLSTNNDGTGAVVPGIDIAEGGVGLQIVIFPPPDGAASSTPDVRLAITMPDGTVRYIKPKLPPAAFQHRMSWRLLGQ